MAATIPDDLTSIDEHIAKGHRVHAAIYAMAGLLAHGMFSHSDRSDRCENYAKLAVQQADALLAELAK